jgi:hypothetical protein
MSELTTNARGGEYATSRRPRAADHAGFILTQRSKGVPVSAIAQMIGCNQADVALIAEKFAAEAPARPAPVVPERKRKAPPPEPLRRAPRVVLSLWKGEIIVNPQPITMREIAEDVAYRHGVSVDDLTGPSRAKMHTGPRQEAMWMMSKAKRWSLPRIGQFFGDRDHTTVLHGVRRHEQRLKDEQAALDVESEAA